MHWPNIERQQLSFRRIIKATDLNNKSILDIGCGFGDLYLFLKEQKIKFEYHGIDIADKIIEIGKKKNKIIADKLIKGNFLLVKFNINIDYAIISGTFNLKIDNNWDFLQKTLKKAFKICKLGVVFNCISTYVDYKEDHLYYVDPCKVFTFCKTLTKWVNIIYDYNPYEFMVQIYKNKNI